MDTALHHKQGLVIPCTLFFIIPARSFTAELRTNAALELAIKGLREELGIRLQGQQVHLPQLVDVASTLEF